MEALRIETKDCNGQIADFIDLDTGVASDRLLRAAEVLRAKREAEIGQAVLQDQLRIEVESVEV